MASKSQLIDYIVEHYTTKEGIPASMSKLDGYKKADLEEFIDKNKDSDNLEKWLASKK